MHNPIREKRWPDIDCADNLDQLKAAREREQRRLEAELISSPADEAIVALNELHDALIVRVLMLAENDLARSGLGAPPVPYAYMLYGSGGRLEQTMHSDQDSGLVYADARSEEEEERNRSYFLRLADTAVEYLIAIGYPPCEGSVIASNPEWNLPLTGWSARIASWFAEPNWENVRYLLIAADARAVWGDAGLADRLRSRYFGDLLSHPVIEKRMLENTLRHKVLVGVFGQLLTERYGENAGSLDIKYGAYIPMVNAFRLLAMRAGIRETSTLRRIDALRNEEVLAEDEAEEAKEAFELFLKLRLFTSVAMEDGYLVGTGKLPASRLTKEMIAPLKKALKIGSKVQRKVQKELQYRFGGR
ncbi:DUF294 nucleotidyltransferase-like domain-containing protein [Cohnella hongkongensis]|uniref:DUF294 nucleotidyltransferase-like domain-containing protein n=1 Tax=Cohnella hongkongensis TaxID=178337 RepID=A0ABV9FFQ4_9BACL